MSKTQLEEQKARTEVLQRSLDTTTSSLNAQQHQIDDLKDAVEVANRAKVPERAMHRSSNRSYQSHSLQVHQTEKRRAAEAELSALTQGQELGSGVDTKLVDDLKRKVFQTLFAKLSAWLTCCTLAHSTSWRLPT